MSPKDPTGKREREGEGVYCGVACNNTVLFDCFVSDLSKNLPALLKRSTWSRSVTASCLATSTASFTPCAVLRSTATQRTTSCDVPEPCSSSFKYLQQRLGASHQQEDRIRLHHAARLAETRKTCVLSAASHVYVPTRCPLTSWTIARPSPLEAKVMTQMHLPSVFWFEDEMSGIFRGGNKREDQWKLGG